MARAWRTWRILYVRADIFTPANEVTAQRQEVAMLVVFRPPLSRFRPIISVWATLLDLRMLQKNCCGVPVVGVLTTGSTSGPLEPRTDRIEV